MAVKSWRVLFYLYSMAVYTTLADGHVHCYAVETSPEIEVNGGHYHYYRGAARLLPYAVPAPVQTGGGKESTLASLIKITEDFSKKRISFMIIWNLKAISPINHS